jgi:hypothetical protein
MPALADRAALAVAADDTAPHAHTIVDLGTLAGRPESTAYSASALNGGGRVVGSAYGSARHAPILYSGGTLSRLPTPGDIVEAEARWLNTGGPIAGWTRNGSGLSSYYNGHAALWQGGFSADLV